MRSAPLARGAALLLLALAAGPAIAAQGPSGRPAISGLDLYMPRAPHEREDIAVVSLGRRLFFDPVLSRDSTLACASCHQPDHGFSDGNPVSVGVFGRRGTRNVPTLVNRAWGKAFFWDGRTASLEAQVLQPITAAAEMDMTVEAAVSRLRGDREYEGRFRSVFGEGPTEEGLQRSLAAYVRTIRAGASPFDRAMEGDPTALSALEQTGLDLFRGRARCARCHSGALLTDESFHNTGVAWRDGEPADSGRALVTGRDEDVGTFKTPTLRQLPSTAPYMHDGSLRTLAEVVDFYDRGGHRNPYLDLLIRPLDLSDEEKRALVAFLGALGGRIEEGVP